MHEQWEFVRGIFHTAVLTTTPQDVGTAGTAVRVKGFILDGGAAAEIVIFRSSDGATEYFRLPIGIGGHINTEIPFYASGGLEILTASAAGDVYATVFYYDD